MSLSCAAYDLPASLLPSHRKQKVFPQQLPFLRRVPHQSSGAGVRAAVTGLVNTHVSFSCEQEEHYLFVNTKFTRPVIDILKSANHRSLSPSSLFPSRSACFLHN